VVFIYFLTFGLQDEEQLLIIQKKQEERKKIIEEERRKIEEFKAQQAEILNIGKARSKLSFGLKMKHIL
jgi:hypothetical protein